MLKTKSVIALLAFATLALPAAAGLSSPDRTCGESTAKNAPVSADGASAVATGRILNGFEYTGGDAGWQVAQHRFVLRDGRFAHSEECDHQIRTVAKPTFDEIDEFQSKFYGGK